MYMFVHFSLVKGVGVSGMVADCKELSFLGYMIGSVLDNSVYQW